MTIYISVEGQSEEVFAEHFLKPYLRDNFSKYIKVIPFGVDRYIKGGISSFHQQVAELKKIIDRATQDRKYHLTTMYDLADLHKDMPRFEDYSKLKDPYQKVAFAEQVLKEQFPNPDFIPHYQLYQFETLVFSKPDSLLKLFPGKENGISQLQAQLEEVDHNPERINSHNKPSYRMRDALQVDDKAFKGRPIGELAGELGIRFLKDKCKHFGAWVSRLEQL